LLRYETAGHMTEERARQRLAAILAGDVVGYSRLIEAGADGRLAALKSHRCEFIDLIITGIDWARLHGPVASPAI
jgi:hypothetical protein